MYNNNNIIDTIKSIGIKLIDIIFNENPTIKELLTLAIVFSIFWGIFFRIGIPIIKYFVSEKEWLLRSFEKDYEREGKKLMTDFGTPMSLEEYIDLKINQWPWMQMVLLQHAIGGCLCLPSILYEYLPTEDEESSSWMNFLTPNVASSLACLGIISEMGWEIEDLVSMFYRRLLTKDGKKTVPDIMLIIMPMHHSLTICLAIPMILNYRHTKELHELCFDLQAASSFCLWVGEYTKLLDISKYNELLQFRFLTFLGLLVAIWTRGIHWIYLIVKFCIIWYNDKAWTFFIVGIVICIVFSAFSMFLIILPFYQRFVKFMSISRKYVRDTSSLDLSDVARRQSIMNLEEAANELTNVVSNDIFSDGIAKTLLENSRNKQLKRRKTIPNYMLQQHKRLSIFSDTNHRVSRAASIYATNKKSNVTSSLVSPELQKELESLVTDKTASKKDK